MFHFDNFSANRVTRKIGIVKEVGNYFAYLSQIHFVMCSPKTEIFVCRKVEKLTLIQTLLAREIASVLEWHAAV